MWQECLEGTVLLGVVGEVLFGEEIYPLGITSSKSKKI